MMTFTMSPSMIVASRSAALAAVAAAAIGATGGAALAQNSSCQTDFQKMMEPRQKLIERINSFRNKRPTAGQACSTLGSLVSADQKLIGWLNENKEWCQIPDQLIEQLQTASSQASPLTRHGLPGCEEPGRADRAGPGGAAATAAGWAAEQPWAPA